MSNPEHRICSIEWDPSGQSYLDWGRAVVEDYMGKPAISIKKHDYGLDNSGSV